MTSALAHMVANFIQAQGLSEAQALQTGYDVLKILGGLEGPPSPAEVQTDRASDPRGVEVPRPIRVIAKSGGLCACIKCSKNVYKVVSDILDPMKVGDFIDAFEPIGHDKKLSFASKIQTLESGTTTDCPLCKGSFSLALIGRAVPGEDISV